MKMGHATIPLTASSASGSTHIVSLDLPRLTKPACPENPLAMKLALQPRCYLVVTLSSLILGAASPAVPATLAGCDGCEGSITNEKWEPKPGYPTLSGFLMPTNGACVGENCRPSQYCSLTDELWPLTVTGVNGQVPIYQCETLYIPGPPISKGPRICSQVGTQVAEGPLVWVRPRIACDTSLHFEILLGGLSGSKFSMDVSCSGCAQ
jgi:hypothetical protein